MVLLGYSLVQLIEIFLGMWILHKVYPDPRPHSGLMKLLGGITFFIAAILFIWNAWESYISNLVILFGNALWAFIYSLYFKCPFHTSYIWENFYNVMISLLKMPILILTGLLQNKIFYDVNRGERNFVEVFWWLLIEILIFVVVKKKKDIDKLLRVLLFRYKKLLVVMFAVEWCMLTYSMYLGQWGFAFIDFILHLIFIICSVLLILYLILRILYQEIKSEHIMLDTVQKNLQSQNDKLQNFYNQNNQQLHNIKHIMIYIRNCLESGKIEEALTQVCDFTDNLMIMERKVWTGFPFLDFLINLKKYEMEEKEIDFELEVDLYEIPIKDAELGVILGNLFDNAIEATQKCDLSNRKIFLRICNLNEMFLLSLCNSSIQIPMMVHDRFVTTKKDQYAHGLGVESVRRIVEKYNGNITFQYDDEHFEVDILI